MNIACTACSARYGVADEKLIGKRVRITCKRCGTVLIVDGNQSPPAVSASTSMAPSPPAAGRPAPSRPAPEEPPKAPAPEPPFLVAFADGRQEQADVAQIVRFHRAGQLGADSMVWREGMAEWVDPWDVPEIAAAFRRMGYARPSPPPAPELAPAREPLRDAIDDETTRIHESNPQHQAPLFDDSEDTHVVDSSPRGSPAPLRNQRAASTRVAEEDDAPTQVAAPVHVTARRTSNPAREPQRAQRVSTQPSQRGETPSEEYQRARLDARAQGTARKRSSHPPAAATPPPPAQDLFSRQARAGSEEEQAEQASLAAGHELDIPRLTGARNESSVLFSLDSLLKQEKKSVSPARPPRRDETLLVDTGSSLPVGGGIAAALSAPDFTAPISAPPPRFATEEHSFDEDRGRSSRAWVYVVLLLAFGGAGAFAWKTGALRPVLTKLGLAAPVPASTETQPLPSASEHPARAAESSSAAAEAPASASASSSASAAAGSASAASSAPTANAALSAKPAGPLSARSATPATATPRPASTAKGAAASTKEAPEASKAATDSTPQEAPAAAPAAPSSPFDAAAAKEALAGATANVANCKEMGGPTGGGRVSITFAPSGRPTSVAVTGDFAGTTVGSCVARLYRAVHVPPFSGDPVTVAKSFSVE